MSKQILYTYINLQELRQLQKDNKIYPFIFQDTQELLLEEPNSYIDITALTYLVRAYKENLYSANINLRAITDKSKIIIEQHLANEALSNFPYRFATHEPLYVSKEPDDTNPKSNSFMAQSPQPIHNYNNNDDLDKIIEYAKNHGIPIATFSKASGDWRAELEKYSTSLNIVLLDLTSVSYALSDNKSLIYTVEHFFNTFHNIKVICLTSQADIILKYFPLYFNLLKYIGDLLTDLAITNKVTEPSTCRKITTLDSSELKQFFEQLNCKLIGHSYFKERLYTALKNFILLNRAHEQKIFSLFIYGQSGIGKTEVARIIGNGLLPHGYLAKINFQNYSSQDSLNSLIGSPAGYIGCEHGELSEKVRKSNVGIILCDEFEKTTRPVFSFFLELLEEGKFTDSLAREYDLDGYIVVFTSNIQSESEYKKIIPLELQTRFDLVCKFEEPSPHEKLKFIDLLLENAQKKFAEHFMSITEEEIQHLCQFNYSSIKALRDIKRIYNQRLMDLFRAKGLD